MNVINSELHSELKRDFREFLDHDFGGQTGNGKYHEQVRGILKKFPETKSVRLDVDLQGMSSGVHSFACFSISSLGLSLVALCRVPPVSLASPTRLLIRPRRL
jgi:hypothetical protein